MNRTTIELSDRDKARLQRLCDATEQSSVGVIRRALQIYWVLKEASKDGSIDIVIKNPDGMDRVIIIPELD